jgi:hypothetical protein
MMRRWIFVALIVMFVVPLGFAQMVKDSAKQSCMACCETMMKQHDEMQRQMAGMDARLQSLVDEMNRAEGAARIDTMAAVINELVSQRTTMQKQMSGKDSMAVCPMMKQSEKEPATPAPHEHR